MGACRAGVSARARERTTRVETTPGWGPLASDLAFSVSLSKSSFPLRSSFPLGATLRERSGLRSSQPPHALLFARRRSWMQGSRDPRLVTSIEQPRSTSTGKSPARKIETFVEFATVLHALQSFLFFFLANSGPAMI